MVDLINKPNLLINRYINILMENATHGLLIRGVLPK